MWYKYSVAAGLFSDGSLIITISNSEKNSKASAIKTLAGLDINDEDQVNKLSKVRALPEYFNPPATVATTGPQIGQVPAAKASAFNWKKYSEAQNPIQKMQEMNANIPEDLQTAKDEYISKAKQLNPTENSETLNEHWDNYTDELRKHSHLPNSSFLDYNSWKKNYPDDLVTQLFVEHKGPKAIDGDYDVNKKSIDLYNAEKDLDKMHNEFGITSEETNPFAAFSDIRKQWAQKVGDHFKEQVPYGGKENSKVTLFTGYPGAGKSRFIEPNQTSNEPVRMTDYGVLVDPDEYQKSLPGFLGGAGSQNTLVYANSVVKPAILKEAFDKGNDVVIPFVGGTADAILNEAINHIINNRKVDILYVPTDANVSHQRSLHRAKSGGRLIAPYTTGNPDKAFVDAQNIIKNPDYNLPDIFTKKLLTKLDYTPAQIKKLPLHEKQTIHNQYARLISFDIAK